MPPFSPRLGVGHESGELQRPTIHQVGGAVSGSFPQTPLGVILHGSRSGHPKSIDQEWRDTTFNWVPGGAMAAGLGWNITVGNNVLGVHMTPRQWGYNAREHSDEWLAAEFAQGQLGGHISDEQIEAFCWWFVNVARVEWPNLPAVFPNHSELAAGIRDGKTDVELRGQSTTRDRILARLG